jgi:hypothetical protein
VVDKGKVGDDISVIPLIPIPVEGLIGKSMVRALVESLYWFKALNATEMVLMKGTIELFIRNHLTSTSGQGWIPGLQFFLLPVGLDTKATVAYVSEGWGSMPDSIPPLSTAAETELLGSILAMLNDAFGTNLDLDPCLARKMADISDQRTADASVKIIATVGSSHADNVASALEQNGSNVQRITDRKWKLSAANVTKAVESIGEMEHNPDLILIRALDNNVYFVASEDGTLSLPVRGADNRYHIPGELRIATKDQVNSVLKTLKPLLSAHPSIPKIVILPLPRYSDPALKCCADKAHLTNSDTGIAGEIKSRLMQSKRRLGAFFSRKRSMVSSLLIPIL